MHNNDKIQIHKSLPNEAYTFTSVKKITGLFQ